MRGLTICIFYNITMGIKSRRTRWAGQITRMGEIRNSYKILVCKPEGKRGQRIPTSVRRNTIKMTLKERGSEYVN